MKQKYEKYFEKEYDDENEQTVINEFSDVFNYNNIDNLKKEDMDYLNFSRNKHWHNIHRSKTTITTDMDKLKKSLKMLLNEKIPINKRINDIKAPKTKYYIKGFGKATLTPILFISNPKKYGIYNSKSEKGLKKIGMHPNFEKNDKLGEKYTKINKILINLAEKYDLSLWELDFIWYDISQK